MLAVHFIFANKKSRLHITVNLWCRGYHKQNNTVTNNKNLYMSTVNTEQPCIIDNVNSRCKNCNEPIHFDEFTKTWMHERSIAFFDNAWYCDNLHRTTGAEPID